ncbi:Hypothetical predicted protein [Pelobates cultripes]|uniref:Uncharacterized protein n=1 Tax=Pelobates cultripes TaxID=61616 RepID=A0AAD1S1J7_PELCU|nr:Hypothetical predicted protein [Pelobates cultripes]
MAETARLTPRSQCMKDAHPTNAATNAIQRHQMIRHPQSPAVHTHPGTLTEHLPRVTLQAPGSGKGMEQQLAAGKGAQQAKPVPA